ncbi:MAG: hypothetical protein R2873_22470 [Caldilineaceae bacterium]
MDGCTTGSEETVPCRAVAVRAVVVERELGVHCLALGAVEPPTQRIAVGLRRLIPAGSARRGAYPGSEACGCAGYKWACRHAAEEVGPQAGCARADRRRPCAGVAVHIDLHVLKTICARQSTPVASQSIASLVGRVTCSGDRSPS